MYFKNMQQQPIHRRLQLAPSHALRTSLRCSAERLHACRLLVNLNSSRKEAILLLQLLLLLLLLHYNHYYYCYYDYYSPTPM